MTRITDLEVKAADGELAMRLAHHDRAVAEAKSAAMGNLQVIAADAACDLVAKLTGAQVSKEAADAAVRRVMANG